MDITELKQEKAELEAAISKAVTPLVTAFIEKCGVDVNRVNFQFVYNDAQRPPVALTANVALNVEQ